MNAVALREPGRIGDGASFLINGQRETALQHSVGTEGVQEFLASINAFGCMHDALHDERGKPVLLPSLLSARALYR